MAEYRPGLDRPGEGNSGQNGNPASPNGDKIQNSSHPHLILDALKGERLPAVLVDLDAFDRNLDRLAYVAKGSKKKIRIATKSIRVPELISRALSYGPPPGRPDVLFGGRSGVTSSTGI